VRLTFVQLMKEWARAVKRDVVALWIAARDPRTPWHGKVVAGLIAAYALSPIDLIPEFRLWLGVIFYKVYQNQPFLRGGGTESSLGSAPTIWAAFISCSNS
jgi:hypothetical protein